MSVSFKEKELMYETEIFYPVEFKKNIVGKNYFDFLVQEKIIVELKVHHSFSEKHFDQVKNYLNVSNHKLALLIKFGTDGVDCKRVVNFKAINPEPQPFADPIAIGSQKNP